MATFVRLLLALSLACISVCKAVEIEQSHLAVPVGINDRVDHVERPFSHGNAVDETQAGKTSLTQSDRTDSVTMMNNLRRTVGSSNMNYMTYDVSSEIDASSWTPYCDFDRTVAGLNFDNAFEYITPDSTTIPDVIKEIFKKYTRDVSSVYLTSFGCDLRKCSIANYKGVDYENAMLALCLFQGESAYDANKVQYKLGEGCTECNSGSFWCDYGLCRGTCAPSDSCYCNSNCLNCASTDPTTCTCQCLQGWSGSRCEIKSSVSATTPICSTTARPPRILTTIDPNSAAPIIGTSILQIVLWAAVVLFLRA